MSTWVPRCPSTQVRKLKVTQCRDICHKFTAATARCQHQPDHHHNHRGDDHHGWWEGQSRDWGETSFSPNQLEYNGFTGDKNWAPSNTFQIPISTASVPVSVFQSWSSDFRKLNIVGAGWSYPSGLSNSCCCYAASTVMTWRWRRLD